MKRVLIMQAEDNIANAVEDITKGDTFGYLVDGEQRSLQAVDDVPFGFKVAVKDIAVGGDIVKYKQVIGKASRAIKAGECVHIHNIEGTRGRGDR